MVHALSEDFFKRFSDGGDLNTLIQVLKTYPQYTMFLRGDSATIYYKGLRVLKINKTGDYVVTQKTADKSINVIKKYFNITSNHNNEYNLKLNNCSTSLNEDQWYDILSAVAKGIDEYKYKDKHQNLEKEIQQQIVFENNMTTNQTDYFIIDMEYKSSADDKDDEIDMVEDEDKNEGRFDAIAWYWPCGIDTPKGLAFIEIKFGKDAVKGDHGITDHLNDISLFVKNKKEMNYLYTDMLKVFEQLYELGLCTKTPGDNKPNFNLQGEIPNSQMIFILANYNQSSKMLKEEFKNKEWQQNNEDLDVLFATSSFMGYGLYNHKNCNCMVSAKDFIKMVNKE